MVRPVSTISSTTRTSFPSIPIPMSFLMTMLPELTVPLP